MVGLRRGRFANADRRDGGDDGRKCPRRIGGFAVGGPKRLARSNAEQVRIVRGVVEGLGLEVASPDEARDILSLKGADKVAF